MNHLAKLTVLAILLQWQTAFAWDTTVSSDQMTDKKFAMIAQVATGSPYGIMIKCWEDDTIPNVVLATDIPYDNSAPWADSASGKIRFDKEAALDITYSPIELGGRVAIDISMEDTDFRQKFFNSFSSFNDVIHIQLAKKIIAIPAKDIKAKREPFFAICSQKAPK